MSDVYNAAPTAKQGMFKNKWTLLLVIIILLLIGGMGFYLLFTRNKLNNFTPGTTYEGTWKTPNLPDLPIRLTITSVKNDKLTITYEFGTNPLGYANSYSINDAKILNKNETLTWGGENGSFLVTFHQLSDGTLKGEKSINNIRSLITLKPIISQTNLSLNYKKTKNIKPCDLNEKFKPISNIKKLTFNSWLNKKPAYSNVKPFIGAYEGKIGSDDVRLVIFPDATIHFVTKSMNIKSSELTYRNSAVVNNEIIWKTIENGQIRFSYSGIYTNEGLFLHTVKHIEGHEFYSTLKPCAVNN